MSDLLSWFYAARDTKRVLDWMEANFPGAVVLERHDRNMRLQLGQMVVPGCPWRAGTAPAAQVVTTLAECFEKLDCAKKEVLLMLDDYGISQTSLEQIFNQFAAQQDEETGAVAGMAMAHQPAAPAAPVGVGDVVMPPAVLPGQPEIAAAMAVPVANLRDAGWAGAGPSETKDLTHMTSEQDLARVRSESLEGTAKP